MPTTDYREIPLTRGLVAIVDECDFIFLTQWKWHAMPRTRSESFDAVRHVGGRKNRHYVKMQRLLTKAGKKYVVDHINRNTLDNRRSNLRITKQINNSRNRGMNSNNKSGYKGVYWHKFHCKWYARIRVNYKSIFLGLFHDPKKAAQVYDEAARRYFGEFSCVNFPH